MTYKINIDNREIELPNEFDIDERISFCQEVINDNIDFFTYEIPTGNKKSKNASDKVKTRLRVMGEYIYSGSVSGVDDTVITQWRNSRNKKREVMFCDLRSENFD